VKLPRALLIDLDDTIISAYNNPRAVWVEVATEFAPLLGGLEPEFLAATIAEHADRFWAEPGHHRWRQDLFEARRAIAIGACEAIAAAGGPRVEAATAAELADRFSRYREERMHLFPGALEAVDALRASGVLLALVTNGAGPLQRPKIERFGLASRFHHIQIEGEHGFGKPEERAYRHAMAALGVAAHDTWMVGDNLEWEVAAPQRLGIFGVWHDHAGTGLPEGSTVVPDRIIQSLSELVPG
jgi:putative hydrolase of the HAD superfamily